MSRDNLFHSSSSDFSHRFHLIWLFSYSLKKELHACQAIVTTMYFSNSKYIHVLSTTHAKFNYPGTYVSFPSAHYACSIVGTCTTGTYLPKAVIL